MITINRIFKRTSIYVFKKLFNAIGAGFKNTTGFDKGGIGTVIFFLGIAILFGYLFMFALGISLTIALLYLVFYILYGTEKGIKFTNSIFNFFGVDPHEDRDLKIHNSLKELSILKKKTKIVHKKTIKMEKRYAKLKSDELLQDINSNKLEEQHLNVSMYKVKKNIVKQMHFIRKNKKENIFGRLKGASILVALVAMILYSVYQLTSGLNNYRLKLYKDKRDAKEEITKSMYLYDDLLTDCSYSVNSSPRTLEGYPVSYNFQNYASVHKDVTNDLNLFERMSNKLFYYAPSVLMNGLLIKVEVNVDALKKQLRVQNLGSMQKQLKLQADHVYGRLFFENKANLGFDTSIYSKSNEKLACRFEFLNILENGKNMAIQFYDKDTGTLITSFNDRSNPWGIYSAMLEKSPAMKWNMNLKGLVSYAQSVKVSTLYRKPFLTDFGPEFRSKREKDQMNSFFR